jgi:hypothetical protein
VNEPENEDAGDEYREFDVSSYWCCCEENLFAYF